MVRWQSGRLQGIANPFGKPHAGSNPALTSKLFLLAIAAFLAIISKINLMNIVETNTPTATPKASRSQQRTRSEILMRAIANENVFLVSKLVGEGVALPSKYDGMDVETFIFHHFNPQIADVLKMIPRKWDLSKIGALLQSPPSPVLNNTQAWAQFVIDVGASSALGTVFNGILTRWKNLDPLPTSVLCAHLANHPNAGDWGSQIVKTNASRTTAMLSVVHLQSQSAWDVLKPHWDVNDLIKFADEVSRGVPLTGKHIDFFKSQLQNEPLNNLWAESEKILARNCRKFEAFYKKTFGPFSNTAEFIASHTAVRWQSLSDNIDPQAFQMLGLPWWRSVQAQGRAVVKSTLGNDVPSQSPRCFEHALLVDSNFAITAHTSPRFVNELRTPFDAYWMCQRSPTQLKKMLVDLPSLRSWKDEHHNNLGHYIVAFAPLNKSLLNTMVKISPKWFEQTNDAGASVVGVLTALHPTAQDLSSHITQSLLKKTVKKPTKKASVAVRKM